MKKHFLLAAFSLVSLTAFTQTYQGQWMLGGNMDFKSGKYQDSDETITMFNLTPSAGYFFLNNLAGGIKFNFSSIDVSNNNGQTATDVFISPFLRYYFLPATQKVNVFLEGYTGWGAAGTSDKYAQNQFGFMAGPAIFLNKNVALEIGLNYLNQGGEAIEVNGNRWSEFDVNIGFRVHLGRGKTQE